MENIRKLTIFTPTFNRAYILETLYLSLTRQTCKDFIWVIVDDGSIDNTFELCSRFINEGKIKIEYYFQNNSGKMKAHNYAVKKCNTEFFFCVDSDDYLVDKAVELLYECMKTVESSNVSGIIAYRGESELTTLNGMTFDRLGETTLNELYANGFKSDTSLIFKSSILKQNLFQEVEGENFIPEAILYDKLDQSFKLQIMSKILVVCKYLEDGYTTHGIKLLINNPIGAYLTYKQKFSFEKRVCWKIKYAIEVICFNKFILSKRKMKCGLGIYSAFYPLGYLLYLKRKKYKKNE